MAGAPPSPGFRWTGLIGAALRARLSARIRLIGDTAYWRDRTAAIQRTQLRQLLRIAAGTEIGRAHGFARLAEHTDDRMLAEYRGAVPVGDWYAYKDRLERMRRDAEPDVLWPGVVRDFAQTSGTTAGDKYLPISRQMLRSNFRAALDIFANAARFGHSLARLTSGRILFLGGSTSLAENDRGVRTGDLSGLVTPMIRWPLTRVYSPGKRIALMDDWPRKIEAMANACVDQDIRMINGMPSWASVLMSRVLERAAELGRPGRCIREIWPNLDLFVHGGVKYAPFDPRMRELYSGSPTGEGIGSRLEIYPASEGFIAIQDTPGEGGMRLLADIGNFYEFIPLEEIDDPGARAFTCEQVDKGQRYVVTMSTCAGLWRYIIGDVVEFDTIPSAIGGRGGDGPCRVRIVGRHRHFINAFGENLIVEHIETAVARAAEEVGLTVGEFTAAPVYPRRQVRAGLELAIEIEAKPEDPDWLDRFGRAFDRALKDQNVDYTTKRSQDLGMAPPTITPIPIGTFHRWLSARGKLGGQHKCPRCANHRDIIESVIEGAR